MKRSESVMFDQLNNKNVTMRKEASKQPRPRSLVIGADFDLNQSLPSQAQIKQPFEQYKLNVDDNPVVIRKKPTEKVEYTQNISLKYLKPPKPQKPGDIVIIQEPTVQIQPATPLFIREKPEKPTKPAPVIFRENPPKEPKPLPAKEIKIPGKIIDPPPRQVIIEKLPKLPEMPQDIIIERWLSYDKRSRNVVFKPAKPIRLLPRPKNLLIEWEQPDFEIKKEFSFLGVETMDPAEYESKYDNLIKANELPDDVKSFMTPDGEVLAVDGDQNELPLLTGDVKALNYVDLKNEGLAEYEFQL